MTRRQLTFQTVGVELYDGITTGGQGVPTYQASEDVDAVVKVEEELVRGSEGRDVRTTRTLYFYPPDSPVPTSRSRVTIDGTAFIVEEVEEFYELRSPTLHHTRVRCREE